MNWVDVVVLVVVAFSGMLGLLKGLVREVLGVVAWAGAGIAGVTFFPQVQGIARRSIANPDIADPVAFGVVFLAVLIVLSLIARTLGGAARRSALGGLDRTLGLLFGLARGALVVIAAYVIAGIAEPVDQWPPEVLEARSLPSIYLGATWAVQRLPETYRPALSIPPAGRQASSAELLHANPVGRALSAMPARH
jgi:membrane protein required for colicin V production